MSYCPECFNLGLASAPCPRCGRWRDSTEADRAAVEVVEVSAAPPIFAEELAAIEARAQAALLDTKLWSLSPVGAASAEECAGTAEFVEHAKADVLRLAAEVRRLHSQRAQREDGP